MRRLLRLPKLKKRYPTYQLSRHPQVKRSKKNLNPKLKMSQSSPKSPDDVSDIPSLTEICDHFRITPNDLMRLLRHQMLVNKKTQLEWDKDLIIERDRIKTHAEIAKYQYQLLIYTRKLKNEEATDH
jgi:hypothetical protein